MCLQKANVLLAITQWLMLPNSGASLYVYAVIWIMYQSPP